MSMYSPEDEELASIHGRRSTRHCVHTQVRLNLLLSRLPRREGKYNRHCQLLRGAPGYCKQGGALGMSQLPCELQWAYSLHYHFQKF